MLPPPLGRTALPPNTAAGAGPAAGIDVLVPNAPLSLTWQSTLNTPAAQGPDIVRDYKHTHSQGAQATRQRARGKAAARRAGHANFAQEKQEPAVHAVIEERRLAAQKLPPTDIVYGSPVGTGAERERKHRASRHEKHHIAGSHGRWQLSKSLATQACPWLASAAPRNTVQQLIHRGNRLQPGAKQGTGSWLGNAPFHAGYLPV